MAVLGSGCSSSKPDCGANVVAGVSVHVVDLQEAPVCDVTVRITDGAYMEESTLDLGACVFHGADERAGTYAVTILRDDMVLTEESVVVPAGECHVEHQDVTVVLNE
jgi:hypothetical protein